MGRSYLQTFEPPPLEEVLAVHHFLHGRSYVYQGQEGVFHHELWDHYGAWPMLFHDPPCPPPRDHSCGWQSQPGLVPWHKAREIARELGYKEGGSG